MDETREIVIRQAYSIDMMVSAWVDAKSKRSGSRKTSAAYFYTISSLRGLLAAGGLDLDSDPTQLRLLVQKWASTMHPNANAQGAEVAASTYNQRLAIISSFYDYARKMRMLEIENPIDVMERRRVQDYAHAEALESQEIRTVLAQIKRESIEGKRDYAILSVTLHTGRRVSEIAGMLWDHLKVRPTKKGELVSVHFPRLKGGKVGNNNLESGTSTALIEYLHAFYGADLGHLDNRAPVWVSLSHNGTYGHQLSARSLERICEKHCHTGKFHTLRSSFAVGMENAGAKVSEIQHQLGHESLATTGRYLAHFKSATNRHGAQLETMFGISAQETEEPHE